MSEKIELDNRQIPSCSNPNKHRNSMLFTLATQESVKKQQQKAQFMKWGSNAIVKAWKSHRFINYQVHTGLLESVENILGWHQLAKLHCGRMSARKRWLLAAKAKRTISVSCSHTRRRLPYNKAASIKQHFQVSCCSFRFKPKILKEHFLRNHWSAQHWAPKGRYPVAWLNGSGGNFEPW